MQHPHRPIRLTRTSAATLLAMFTFARVLAAEDAAVSQDNIADSRTVHAIWFSQNVPFKFRSDRTSYTCESFKEKVRAVLVAVGVHASLIVELRCDPVLPVPKPIGRPRISTRPGGEIANLPAGPTHIDGTSSRIYTRIALAAPAIANEQSIRHATTFDEQQLLSARMRNVELPTPSTITVFPARWTSIHLSGSVNPRLEADDCDLLRQLSQQVLPTIGIRVTRKVTCSTAARLSKPSLNVEALMPAAYVPATVK